MNEPSNKACAIVCTCNRGTKLAAAIECLVQQVVPPGWSYEVVVVDNNSVDETRSVVEQCRTRWPGRIRYLFEPRQGKSFALNHGFAATDAAVVLVTDDDCLVQADWLAAMLELFAADAELGVIGGWVGLNDPRDRPVSIRTREEAIPFERAGQVFSLIPGCNLGLRREVFERVGPFDSRLGPGAPGGVIAEDTDFLFRAFRGGERMLYSPRPRVLHDHGRRTDDDVARLHRDYVQGRGALYCKHVLHGDRVAMRMTWWEVRACLRSLLRGGPDPGHNLTLLRHLAVGAWRWLTVALRARDARSPQVPPSR